MGYCCINWELLLLRHGIMNFRSYKNRDSFPSWDNASLVNCFGFESSHKLYDGYLLIWKLQLFWIFSKFVFILLDNIQKETHLSRICFVTPSVITHKTVVYEPFLGVILYFHVCNITFLKTPNSMNTWFYIIKFCIVWNLSFFLLLNFVWWNHKVIQPCKYLFLFSYLYDTRDRIRAFWYGLVVT